MTEQDEVDFCELVDNYVEKHYGYRVGSDVCFNLVESRVIPEDASVEQAAVIVVQYTTQE